MYRSGHLGIGFILTIPMIFYLYLLGFGQFIAVYIIIFGLMSVHPDIDLKLQRYTNGMITHRGITHTLLYGFVISIIFMLIMLFVVYYIIPNQSINIDLPNYMLFHIIFISLYTGVGGIFSHVLGDVITPSGLSFLWPWKDKKYSLNYVYARDFFANLGFFILGIVMILSVNHYLLDTLMQSVLGVGAILTIQADKVFDIGIWSYKFRKTMSTYFRPEFALNLESRNNKLRANFEDGRKNDVVLEQGNILKGKSKDHKFIGKIGEFNVNRRLLRKDKYYVIFSKSKIMYRSGKVEKKKNNKKSARLIIKEIDEDNYRRAN